MTDMQGALPFLDFNGVEVANAARTLSYLRGGLGSAYWELWPADVCSVLYRQLGGTCGTPDVFVSPASDPAPWYDATRPESGDFLGVYLTDISGYDSVIQRTVTPRPSGLGGGTLASEQNEPRVWKFDGYLASASCEGAEYGLEWLTYVLSAIGSGAGCDSCAASNMRVYLSCPPDDCSDDTIGEWYAYEAALTDGPHKTEFGFTCCDVVEIEFTITTGNPYLYKRPAVCLDPSVVGAVMPPIYDFCYWLTGVASH